MISGDMADAHETARERDARASTVTYEVHMCTEGNADFDHVINCPALHTLSTRTHAINPTTGEFTPLDFHREWLHVMDTQHPHTPQESDMPNNQRRHREQMGVLDQINDTLTEIRDRLPEYVKPTLDWLDEPIPVPRPEPACICGSVDGFDCCPDPAPADVDPDEALAKVLCSAFWGGQVMPSADNADWTNVTRAAREHIEAEDEGRAAHKSALAAENLRRAEKAEADLARVTEERDRHSRAADKWCNLYADKCEEIESVQAKAARARVTKERDEQTRDAIEWRNRYEALREDVERFWRIHRRNWTVMRGLGDALARDNERAES